MKQMDIDEELKNSSHDKSLFTIRYIFYIYSIVHKVQTLIIYPGGKLKMMSKLNEIFSFLSSCNKYTTYIDGFFGMGGSLKALSESLLKHGVKKVIVNDINSCIISLHKDIRNSKDEMIEYYIETLRTDIVIPYGKLYISTEEFLAVKRKLITKFYKLQDKKEFGVETSTLLIMLSSFNFSGVLDIRDDGKIRFAKGVYKQYSIYDFLEKTIKRIETYSELYNKFEMEFYNEDYFKLHRHLKGMKNTIWNIDTVYVKEDSTPYIKEEMEKTKSEDIQGCSIDYGQHDFDHKGVLESLKEIDFLYNNYVHPIMYHYVDKFDLNYDFFKYKKNINGKADTKVKNVTEIILYKNNFKQVQNNTNFPNPTKESA